MAGRYRFSPPSGQQLTVYRFDTAAGTDTPASLWGPYTDVALRAGGYFKADPLGALPQFRADEAVLWRKPMLGATAIHADAVAVSGVDREPDPSEAFAGGVSQGQVDTSIATAVAGLGATFAVKGLVDVNAADPAFGSTRDVPQIMAAIAAVVAAGGGTVRVLRKDGPWTIDRRVVGQQKEGGILIEDPDITLVSDGAVLNLTNNCDFIRVRSGLGTQVTITADTVITDTNLTVTSSATLTVDQWVFLRLGQAAYDAAEPDQWLYAKVLAIPDGTHVTLDRPVGYALSVSATPIVSQRSIAPIAKLAENVAIDGTWNLVNSMAGSAHAEAGVNLQNVMGCRVGTIIGTNPGSGAVVAQFVEGLTVATVKVAAAESQSDIASKGRVVSIAASRGVHLGLVEAENFEQHALYIEARADAVQIDRLNLKNTHPDHSDSATALIATVGNGAVIIDQLHASGRGSYLHSIGTSAGECVIREAYFRTSTRPVISDLSVVKDRFLVDATSFPVRSTWTTVIPLTASMVAVDVALPAGYLRRTKVYASSLTGLLSVKFASAAVSSVEALSDLVGGQTRELNQGRGFGTGYNGSAAQAKAVRISTDTTVPAGAFLAVDVDYFATAEATPVTATIPATVGALSTNYEPLIGGRFGRRRERPLAVPTVMASPPTVGALATSSAITSGVPWTTLVSPGVNGSGVTSNIFRVYGTGDPVQYGTVTPDNIVVRYRSVTTTNSATSPYRVAFMFDGTTLEFLFKGMTGAYRIRVDGQLVTASSNAIGNTGAYYRLPVTFASRAQRYIEFEAFGLPFAGVIAGPLDTVWQPQPRGPRCIIVGDSYTEGTGADGSAATSWAKTFSDLMNWPDTFNSGVGSTGYLNPGSAGRVTFRTRITADVTAWNPDIVIVAGGHNDTGSTNGDIQTEVGLYFAALRAALPNATLICAGPFFAGGTPGVYTAMQTSIFAGAAPYVLGSIDTCTAPWFTGSGRVGATTGSGNSDLYISSDGTHPSQAGHDYLGRRMAEAVSGLLFA